MLLGIAFLTFALMGGTPGSYLDSMRLDPQFSEETIAHYEQMYGLDKSWWIQFGSWIKNIFRLELGYSFHYNIPVAKIIGGRLLNTFILSFTSFLITWFIAIPFGIWAALNRNRWIDRCIQFFFLRQFIFAEFLSCHDFSFFLRAWCRAYYP